MYIYLVVTLTLAVWYFHWHVDWKPFTMAWNVDFSDDLLF